MKHIVAQQAEELRQRRHAESRGKFAWSGWEEEDSASNEGGWGSAGGWGTSAIGRWGAATGGNTSEWGIASGGETSGWGTSGKGWGASREDQRGGEEVETEPPVFPLGRPPHRPAPTLPSPDIQPHRGNWDTIEWGNEPSTPRRTVYRPDPELRKPTFVHITIPETNIPFSVILDREFLALMLTTANGGEEEGAEEAAVEPAAVPEEDPDAVHARYMSTSGLMMTFGTSASVTPRT
ncbi:unnamed protein product [Closterium sp. NIES-54]